MKKLIGVMLTLVMVLTFCVPAAAAVTDDPPAAPTIEEILSEYHRKSFEEQSSGNADAPSAYSPRSGSGSQTLEQETVAALTAAGYEAYNVTASNYESLEEELQTDLAELGLDPEGSYVVTVSGTAPGETPASGAGSNSRLIDFPVYDDFDEGSASFTYTEDGVTYTMRYLTLASTTDNRIFKSTPYTLSDIDAMTNFNGDAFAALYSLRVDAIWSGSAISTSRPFMEEWAGNPRYVVLDRAGMNLVIRSAWTRSYIQVWNSAAQKWHTAQRSAYVVSTAQCTGKVYNTNTQSNVTVDSGEQSVTRYSPYYNDSARRKANAVSAYKAGTKYTDCTGDIHFYFFSRGGVSLSGENAPLIVYEEYYDHILR